jgi:hypothetical protein
MEVLSDPVRVGRAHHLSERGQPTQWLARLLPNWVVVRGRNGPEMSNLRPTR